MVHRAAASRQFCEAARRRGFRRSGAVVLPRAVFRRRPLRERRLCRHRDVLSDAARQSGHRLFVATSKAHVFADRIIDHFGLREHFEGVFGAELDGTRADKSHLLEYALRTASVDPSKTLMIGDRSHDMIGASNNAIRGIGVLYGYGSRHELIEAGAFRVCATPKAILDCISRGAPASAPGYQMPGAVNLS